MKITIIGCGNMGKGFAERLSGTNTIFLYDRHVSNLEFLEKQGFGTRCNGLSEALEQSDIVILAIKPQSLQEAAHLFPAPAPKDQILISLLSGTTLQQLKELFSNKRIIRMMPNLALIHGEGMIGLVCDSPLCAKEKEQIALICSRLGKEYWLTEGKINAFTALAGSGPAFALVIMESMIEAGIAMGFSARDSQNIVQHMMRGSLALLEKNDKHPGQIKWQITSPSGTTIAGLRKLEGHGVRNGIMETFLGAYERANDLSK